MPTPPSAPSANAPAVLTEGLGKRFGDVEALTDLSLQVPSGTVLGLLGPNGAGKTTTVRILTTILQPDTGRAEILGHDIAADPRRVRPLIGLAGQYAAVDENLTARENLRLIGKLTHRPAAEIARRTDELIERFDLAGPADRVARTYSGGQRRRLDLAAALVHRPPVLFLDEPTTGLDPRGRNELWAVIGELVADGTTLLLTTQYLEEAERLADRIIVIDDGRSIAEGTASELKAQLGSSVVEVGFTDAAAAQRAVGPLATVGATTLAQDGQTVDVSTTDGGRSALEAVRILDAQGIEPSRLTVREPTLDDVFLRLTGAETGQEADA